MQKQLFSVLISFFLCSLTFASTSGGYAMVNIDHVNSVRKLLSEGDKSYDIPYRKLIKEAQKSLKQTPLSVMDKNQLPPSGDKHDYMSVSPYWWPDPNNPDGPYIRKDGQINPEQAEITDHQHLSKTMKSIFTLGLAYSLSGQEKYAEKALSLADVWFINPETRMNPNLNYGQSIKNKEIGRGSGIIESRHLIAFTDALRLMDKSIHFTESRRTALKLWLNDFYTWLRTSKIGRDEANAKNNHGTWYAAQCVAIGSYTGKHDEVKEILLTTEKRIVSQIDTEGKQPFELVRTTSLNYSHFNALALCILLNEAIGYGYNFHEFVSPDGRSFKNAIDFLYPFDAKEKEWTYQQIKKPEHENAVKIYLYCTKFFKDAKYFNMARQMDPDGLKDNLELIYVTGN